METKSCQNCKERFIIEAEDFDFYKKIALPPPTFCPSCRLQRRLLFRNEHVFFKRQCDLCGKGIISMYDADAPFPVYCQACWWSDQWTPPELDYDPSKGFFEQLRALRDLTPHEATQAPQSVDSEYANFVANTKDAYLSSVILESRDVFYSRFLVKCADVTECGYASKQEKCARVAYAADCYRCKESRDIESCQDTSFSAYCTDLADCYGCINLKHRKYSIFNQPYSKEDYQKQLQELEALPVGEQRKQVQEFWNKNPRRGATVYHSVNCSGAEIYYSKNCRQGFLVNYVRDGAYLFEASSSSRNSESAHDLWDCSIVVDYQSSYEVIGGSRSSNCLFGFLNDDCLNCRYSMFLYGCSSSFGCVGLRNKRYHILNKEYSKEDYERLSAEIRASMQGYGEFFPADLSPFAYNETMAQEYMPLSKDAVVAKGWRWKEKDRQPYAITIPAAEIPSIEAAPERIVNEVIGCDHAGNCLHQCTTAFKIIPQEFAILKQVRASLPVLCPNCRVSTHPLQLWERQCQCAGMNSEQGLYENATQHLHGSSRCENGFSSSYAPERPEIVYCEQCYQTEVA